MSTPHEEQAIDREQLLKESLSEDELRTLLERLQAHEAGAASMPTVGAVVEATGADPNLIGRLLADIRRQTPPQVFQAPQTVQVVEVRRGMSTSFRVIAMIVGLIVGFLVVSLLSVRTVREDAPVPIIEHRAAAGPSGAPAPEAPKRP